MRRSIAVVSEPLRGGAQLLLYLRKAVTIGEHALLLKTTALSATRPAFHAQQRKKSLLCKLHIVEVHTRGTLLASHKCIPYVPTRPVGAEGAKCTPPALTRMYTSRLF